MILPSTIRQLQARQGYVVRVTIPAHVVKFPTGESVPIAQRKEYFAAPAGAAACVKNWNPADFGVTGADPIVDRIPAAALDAFFGLEVVDLVRDALNLIPRDLGLPA